MFILLDRGQGAQEGFEISDDGCRSFYEKWKDDDLETALGWLDNQVCDGEVKKGLIDPNDHLFIDVAQEGLCLSEWQEYFDD